jgi:hypothetical protein
MQIASSPRSLRISSRKGAPPGGAGDSVAGSPPCRPIVADQPLTGIVRQPAELSRVPTHFNAVAFLPALPTAPPPVLPPHDLRSLRRPTQRVVDVAAGGAGYNEYVAIQPCAPPLACYDTPITGLFLTVSHSCAAVQVPREACCSPRGAQSGHENEADCERIISRQPLRCDRQHGEVLLSVTRTLQRILSGNTQLHRATVIRHIYIIGRIGPQS